MPTTDRRCRRPAERPESDVVIYDGQCRICTAQIRKLPWWDCQGRLSYLSLHDPEVARRFPDLAHDRMMQEMVIVDHYGNRHWGPEAIRYLTRRLRRLWWASPFLVLSRQHVPVAAALPLDRAESLSAERRPGVRRGTAPARCTVSATVLTPALAQGFDRRRQSNSIERTG